MENETIEERPLGETPEPVAKMPDVPNRNFAEKSSGSLRNLIFAGVLLLVIINVAVLYLTNSRVTELEERIATLSSSIESKPAAKPASPARPGGPDPSQNYNVNIEGAPADGPDAAPVTIVEASDFQCPYCAKVEPTLAKVREVYKGNVRIVWKHLPLVAIHPNAMAAATASEAAKKQGKFWEYHDKLFSNQKKLAPEDLRQYASDLKLDMAKFDADMNDPATKKRITDDTAEINALGVTGTPGFFINGRFLNGAQPFEAFASAINNELKRLNLPVPQPPGP